MYIYIVYRVCHKNIAKKFIENNEFCSINKDALLVNKTFNSLDTKNRSLYGYVMIQLK